jgi:SAM-dependent methyltransferase
MMPLKATLEAKPVPSPSGAAAASLPISERVYENLGNPAVVDAIAPSCRRILDVGCGAGDNAALLKSRRPECEVFGITRSEKEAQRARTFMTQCWVDDIEVEVPPYLQQEKFDCLIFSHVLEHLRDPAKVVAQFSRLLSPGGLIVIAVPNILFFKVRAQFFLGRFEYDTSGIMDDTHLHFYTYATADRYLLSSTPDLRVIGKFGDGQVPLWFLRNWILPRRWRAALDTWGSRYWPNMFAIQIIVAAQKQ